jgi:protein-disulfide isomerase
MLHGSFKHMLDESTNEQSNKNASKSVFEALPSKTSFFAGLVAGIMSFSTIGFVVILLGGVDLSKLGLSGGGNNWGAKPAVNTNVNSNANANTNAPADNVLDKMPPITDQDHVRGDLSKAKLVLVEYSDYECPYCKSFQTTLKSVTSSYGSDVAWVYRDFPLSFHQNAQKEAEAAECVASLGGNDAFWKFSDLLYERTTSNGTGFALDKLGPLAKEVGVDQTKFQKCLDAGTYTKKVQDEQAGGSATGIDGTPGTIAVTREGKTSIITGAQPEATVKSTIDSLLKG